MLFYSLGLVAAIIVTSPYWLLRMILSGRYRDGLSQRLGAVPRGLREFVAGRRTIWVHAVSVGEVMAARRLVALLGEIDSSMPVVVSTTTRTGHEIARELFESLPQSGDSRVATRLFYFPLDFRWIVRRFLRTLRPGILVLMESELWPRVLVEAHRDRIPVIIANGRISDRSMPRYRALRVLWRPFLRKLSRVLAQTEQDRQRFIEIGVPADIVETAGNLKHDVRSSSESSVTQCLRENLPPGGKVIVAGSTLEGEESYLLNAFRELLAENPKLVFVLAPRHPERFAEVEALIRRTQLPCLRRSEWMQHPAEIADGSVFLLDSMGELASVYSLASVAFVGGSLVPAGGHNLLEPAQFAVPILTGPYTGNFRGMVATLLQEEAVRVTPPEKLAASLEEMLRSSSSKEMGVRARRVFEDHAGASGHCVTAVVNLLRPAAGGGEQK
jgi:3-deoxy-D-manno-octulosonic-acid transferase